MLDQIGDRLAAVPRPAPPGPATGGGDAVAAAAASLLGYLQAARDHPDAFRLLITHSLRDPEFAERAHALRERGVPSVEHNLTIAAVVDSAVLSWLDLTTPDPGRDADMTRRLARMLASLATT